MSGQFTADIEAWVAQTQARADQVVRAVSLELLSRVVLRSPVGNAELWAANKAAIEGRRAERLFARDKAKRISRKRLEGMFPLVSGQGYVGGRFRGSWTVTFGDPSTEVTGIIDATGTDTLAIGADILKDAKLGVTIYMVSNLPYSERLEQGWSKQAPAGVVAVTVADFDGVVKDMTEKVVGGEEGGE